MTFYRWLLRLFPAPFRARFGDDLADLFADRLQQARRRGAWAVALAWWRAVCDALVQGVAERRASRGGPLSAPSERSSSMIGSFVQDLRFAVRSFRLRPTVTAIAVITIALGAGANTAIFSVVHAVLIRELPYPDPDKLVRVYGTHARYGYTRGTESPADFAYFETHATSFAHLAITTSTEATFTGLGEPVRIRGGNVTPSFFRVMGVAPLSGRAFTDEEAIAEARVVVLSHRFWTMRLGGRAGVVGTDVEINERPWRVIGIMPEGFPFDPGLEYWRPLALTPEDRTAAGSWWIGIIARLAPGSTVPSAQAELDRLARELSALYPAARKDRGFNVVGLQQDRAARSETGILILQGAVALVLLIACANVANLLLALAAERQREFGVRAALGASRARLARQALIESIVLSLTGTAIGVLLAVWGVRALVAMAPPFVLPDPDAVTVDWGVLVVTASVSVVVGVLCGSAPAWLASRFARGGASSSRTTTVGLTWSRRVSLRGALIAAEVALAFVLLVGAGLLIRSFSLLVSQPTGIQTARLLTARVNLPAERYPNPPSRLAFWNELLASLGTHPAVERVAAGSVLPFSDAEWQADFVIKGREEVPNDGAGVRLVSPALFRTLGIPLLKGREFSGEDVAGAEPVMIVSDVFAATHLPGLDPIGQLITFDRQKPEWSRIVGVVGSTRHLRLDEDFRAEMYRPMAQTLNTTAMVLAVRARGDAREAIAPIKSAVAALDPKLPITSIKTIEELMATKVAERRFYMTLLTIFGALAFALAASGIYGVLSFIVAQSRREIGLRLALGARVGQVRGYVVSQTLRLVIIGAGVGAAVALATSRVLDAQLFTIRPSDPPTYLAIAATVIVLGIAAAWLPAARISRVDPAATLRSE